MNFNEKQAAARDVVHGKILEIQELVVRQAKWRTCLNCINFTTVTRIEADGKPTVFRQCQLYRQTPPPEVIVHGCRDWDDDIPF